MKIPSVSGDEKAVGDFLAKYLSGLGFRVDQQEVENGRNNVIARASSDPKVFFSTHMDTVPPFIEPTEDEGEDLWTGLVRCEGNYCGADNCRRETQERRRRSDRTSLHR